MAHTTSASDSFAFAFKTSSAPSRAEMAPSLGNETSTCRTLSLTYFASLIVQPSAPVSSKLSLFMFEDKTKSLALMVALNVAPCSSDFSTSSVSAGFANTAYTS